MPAIPDRRLELMLVCAHPAIAGNIRTPLMLQSVLGVDAAAIAVAFASNRPPWRSGWCGRRSAFAPPGFPLCCPNATTSSRDCPRCSRPFTVPTRSTGSSPEGADRVVSDEALHLALVLADLLPAEPEVLGLAALVCLSEARRPGRRTADGGFVPLDEQDTSRWDSTLIARGETLLRRAHGLGEPDRFQYEAAIQSAHCARAARAGSTPPTLQKLYRACCGRRRRWAQRSPRPRSTARSTARTRVCGPSTRLPTRQSADFSRRGRRGPTY